MPVSQGAGGGRVVEESLRDLYGLDKPYELVGELTPDKVGQLDEMLVALFKAVTRAETAATALQTRVTGLEGHLLVASKTLKHADILTLRTVPVPVVAAPVKATDIIRPVAWSLVKDTSAGAYGADQFLNLQYDGIDTNLMTGALAVLSTADKRYITSGTNATVTHTTDIPGKALVIRAAADFTVGASTNFLNVAVVYYLASAVDEN